MAWAGSVRSLVKVRQFLRWAKPCSTGARPTARTRLASFWPGVSLWARVAAKPVTITGAVNVVVQAAEAEVGQRPEASGAQVGQNVVVAGGGVVVGAAGPGGGHPDQAAPLVGEGEELQAVLAVLAGVVLAVGFPGSALSVDQGALNQDGLPTLAGDRLQGTVQARGLCGEQGDHLVAPATDGGLGDVVAARHVGQALVVAKLVQDDYRDLPGRQDPSPGPDRLQMTPQQVGEVIDGARGQRQTALIDKRAGVLGAFFGSRHTIPTAAGGSPVTPARQRAAHVGSGLLRGPAPRWREHRARCRVPPA